MKFVFIDAEKANWPVRLMCLVLGVTASGFYAWRKRPQSTHARDDGRLRVAVREIFERSRACYGTPRIHAELSARGLHVSRKRVARILRELGLRARVRRRYRATTMSDHDQP